MAGGRAITDFFKPFTIPKNRIPNYEIEEEIVVATPRKLSPVKALNGHEAHGAPPTTSSVLSSLASVSSQSTPTRIRTLESVSIPSPPRASVPTPAPAPVATKATTSFSSVLSSVPHSSQSSSRRIIKNGVPAVTNSDSASVSSSSEDELADFDTLFPAKRRKLTPPGRKATNPIDIASSSGASLRTSTRLSGERTARQYRSVYRPPSPPPTAKYKHSLLKIVKHNQKQAEIDAKIAEAEAEVQDEDGRDAVAAQAEGGDGSASTIAAAFTSTSEDYERMKAAIERTEAMKAEETFYYFCASEPLMAKHPEPYDFSVVDEGFDFLKDDVALRSACATGFLASLATIKRLPDRLLDWTQSAILTERSEALCEAYVAVLAATVKHQEGTDEWVPTLGLGSLGPDPWSSEKQLRELPVNLEQALRVMSVTKPVQAQERERPIKALASLIILSNDESVRQDLSLQSAIEDAMNALLLSLGPEPCSKPLRPNEYASYTNTLRSFLDTAQLSRQMLSRTICGLPATTPRLHALRRTLALSVLLDAANDAEVPETSLDTGVRLLVKLKHAPEFAISERTDYTLLLSLTSLLDIAIDAGFSDFGFLKPEAACAMSAPRDPASLFAPTSKSTSPAEQAFNAQIDAFAAQLTQMKSRIRDAGTSHLKRTEAKSALERLVVRLEYAVRTRPKPRKGVFDKSGSAGMSMGIDAFLKSAGKGAEVVDENVVGGAVEHEDGSH